MRNEFKPYFNENNMLAPHGMNDILYTAHFQALTNYFSKGEIKTLLDLHKKDREYVNSDFAGPISHDNFTAFICLSKLVSLPKHDFKPEHAWWHPRDFIFYSYTSNNKVAQMFGFLLLWISCLIMIIGMWQENYKIIDGKKVLATDGKLLTWLRINTFNLPITKWICDYIVKKKYISYELFFSIYFKDKEHPNNVLISEK